MKRILYGASAIAIVSVVAVLIKAGVEPMPEKPDAAQFLVFFFATAMAMSIGALVFETGKMIAGEKG